MLKMTGVETWKEFLRSQSLRSFGHIERMSKKSSSNGSENFGESEKKKRPKKRRMDIVEEDMKRRGLRRDLARKTNKRGCKKRLIPASEEKTLCAVMGFRMFTWVRTNPFLKFHDFQRTRS